MSADGDNERRTPDPELIAVIAHHFRTPLAVAGTSAALLRERLGPDATLEREHLGNILDAVERMDGLVTKLLAVGRLDAGKVAVVTSNVPVATALGDTARSLAVLADRKRQHLVVHADPTALARCDRELVDQVMHNLVENAIKFAPEETVIELRARRTGDHVHICVIDQGPGIASADLAHVFDRYWQARRGARMGVGLGLYIARAFLEVQGSSIRAESPGGQGTSFCFELPQVAPP